MDSGHPVKLYVYDLSRGMARAMSMSLTGRQIGKHTSIVAYGREYYYGQGIHADTPGTTMHGTPVEVVDMGITHLPVEVFQEFLASIQDRFSAQRYHLLDHNCNTFTSEVSQFLTGKPTPAHITDLPADFLQTPFGQQMRPMIESFFGQSQLAPSMPAPAPAATTTTATISSNSTAPILLFDARNLTVLDKLMAANRAVVVYFTSQGCPPCRLIAPEFRRLISSPEDPQAARKPVIGVTVDTGVGFDVARKYQIRGTPTFMFFLDGNKIEEMVGASVHELKSNIDLLRYSAYPPHVHEKLHLPTLRQFSAQPVQFTALPKPTVVFGKLREFIATVRAADAERAALLDVVPGDSLDALESWLSLWVAAKENKQSFDVESLPDNWQSVMDGLLLALPADKLFPVLDIIRVLLLTRAGRRHYSDSEQSNLLLSALHTATVPCLPDGGTAPTPYILLSLRCVCHLFADPCAGDWTLTETMQTLPVVGRVSGTPTLSPRTVTTELLVHSLLSSEATIRRAAASLAFNVSTRVWEVRAGTVQGEGGAVATVHSHDDEAWLVEYASAIAEAIRAETDEEIGKYGVALYRLACALARLAFQGPSGVAQLLQVLEVAALARSKAKSVAKRPEVQAMLSELATLAETTVEG